MMMRDPFENIGAFVLHCGNDQNFFTVNHFIPCSPDTLVELAHQSAGVQALDPASASLADRRDAA